MNITELEKKIAREKAIRRKQLLKCLGVHISSLGNKDSCTGCDDELLCIKTWELLTKE